jgi:O-antigen ligase/tetratricopeptide (TPR) repeat protein
MCYYPRNMNIINFITLIKKNVVFLLFLVPFAVLMIFDSLFFPYITSKAFFFRGVVEVAFALWVVLAWLEREYFERVWRSRIVQVATIFLVVVFLADFFGVNFYRSFWSNFERMEGFVGLIHIWAYLVLLVSVFKTEKIWNYFWHTVLGSSILVGLYGLFQLVGSINTTQGSRIDATLGNAAYVGTFMFFTSFLTIFLWLKSKKKLETNVMYGAIWFLQVLILYYSATRGALLGFLASIGLILLGLVFAPKVDWKFKKISIGLLVLGVVIAGGFWQMRDSQFIQSSSVLSRFANLSLSDATTISRLTIWKMALKGVEERPVLGWGQDNFIYVFSKYYDPSMYNQEPWFDRSHNIFMDWLVAGGIFGLLAYLALYGTAVWLVIKNAIFDIYEKILLLALLGGYMFQNLFIFDNLTSYILFFALLAFIGLKIQDGESKTSKDKSRRTKGVDPMFYGIAGIVLVIFAMGFYVVNIKPFLVASYIIDANYAVGSGEATIIMEALQKSFDLKTFGENELLNQMSEMSPVILQSDKIDGPTKEAWIKTVDENFTKHIEVYDDARTIYIYASYLARIGNFDKSLEVLDKAIALSPDKQQFGIMKALILIYQKKYQEAREVMKTIYETTPDYTEATTVYALTLAYSGQEAEYQKLVKTLEDPKWGVVSDDRFTVLYSERKEYNKLVSFWQMKIEQNPKDVNLRIKLAGSLYGFGRRGESVKILETALNDFPQHSDQIRGFIESVKAGTAQVQ